MKKTSLLILLTSLLGGCAGYGQVERYSDLSSEQLQRSYKVKFYESTDGLSFNRLGQIKGLSCKEHWAGRDSTEKAARDQLKIKAVKLGANGVLAASCTNNDQLDMANNCWNSWVCNAEAIAVK